MEIQVPARNLTSMWEIFPIARLVILHSALSVMMDTLFLGTAQSASNVTSKNVSNAQVMARRVIGVLGDMASLQRRKRASHVKFQTVKAVPKMYPNVHRAAMIMQKVSSMALWGANV